jgi:hypothetical protein
MNRRAAWCFAFVVATSVSGCQAGRVITNRCERPFIEALGSLDLTVNGATTRRELDGRSVVGPAQPDLVQNAILRNEAPVADTAVTWVISSADAGIRIVVTHRARLAAGQTLTVAGPAGRRDWGANRATAPGTVGVSVDLSGSTSTSTTGTVRVLRVAPLQVELDLTVTPAGGSARRVKGSVNFQGRVEVGPCFS